MKQIIKTLSITIVTDKVSSKLSVQNQNKKVQNSK